MKNFHQSGKACLLLVLLIPMLSARIVTDDDPVDLLLYRLTNADGETSLVLHNPQSHTNTPILADIEVDSFSFNIDGRLAFSSGQEGSDDIYVWNALSPDSESINITQDATTTDHPLAWSPDGRYLAFVSYQDAENRLLYVWDGETAVNITPNDLDDGAESYWEAWSFDGRLAFTVFYDFVFPAEGDTTEIFLWDGTATTSLSQNPTGEDRDPTWNSTGQLAFLSERNGEYDIYVWDGVSSENGLPDRDTFANVSPELSAYYSAPAWTNDNRLVFLSTGPQDSHAQIYLWDGEEATDISQNPTMHNGSPDWRSDGTWAFETFFSAQQLIYVRDSDNHTILTTEGQSSAWNSSGYLTFCTRNSPGWTLSLWDGQEIIPIVQGREIWAQWQSGARVVCSDG